MIKNPYIGMPLEIFMREADKNIAVSSAASTVNRGYHECEGTECPCADGDMPTEGHNFDHMKLGDLPLAMSYVPWQKWGQYYTLEEGLTAGTIFPDLNLPFRGGMRR